MKFTRKKGDTSTIRKVWSDDKKVCYGIVGTVGDLLKAKILIQTDYAADIWIYIPKRGSMQEAWFGATREESVSKLIQKEALK